MIKNILIALLIITNGSTIYYIYRHMRPERHVVTNTRTVENRPEYFFRVTMVDGGKAEGVGMVKKADGIDLIDRKKMTITIPNDRIQDIEKVYYKTGKTQSIITKKIINKTYN